MSATLPARVTRPSALRQRGPRADVCASRFAQSLARPLRHHNCATAPLHHCISAHPASRLTARSINIAGHPGLSIAIVSRTPTASGHSAGFLHRGSLNACQQRAVVRSHSCGRWQASNNPKRTRAVATDDRRPRFCRSVRVHGWPFLCAMDTVANRLLCAWHQSGLNASICQAQRGRPVERPPGVSGNRLAPHAGEPGCRSRGNPAGR